MTLFRWLYAGIVSALLLGLVEAAFNSRELYPKGCCIASEHLHRRPSKIAP
ncbi:hypothetical protein M758_UG101000 [Ceratodon purpureus]|nr:hypothetical protein M758_UG101000 [Ceratodon purpureus]